jgi:hypothetical protein
MNGFGLGKLLVAPAMIPLGLSLFVAMAGPGGVAELGDDAGSTAGGEVVSGEVVSGDGDGETGCFLTVLKDGAQSYLVLEEHVSDPDMPEGGKAGNLNAWDRICYGTVDGSALDTTSAPGKSKDTPGESGEATEPPSDQPDSAPGNSEHSSGNTGGGNANGQGQAKADDNWDRNENKP